MACHTYTKNFKILGQVQFFQITEFDLQNGEHHFFGWTDHLKNY